GRSSLVAPRHPRRVNMDTIDVSRREALLRASLAGAAFAGGLAAAAAAQEAPTPDPRGETPAPTPDEAGDAAGDAAAGATEEEFLAKDRARIRACGLTEAEAECWELAARLAGAFFALPELHRSDERRAGKARK